MSHATDPGLAPPRATPLPPPLPLPDSAPAAEMRRAPSERHRTRRHSGIGKVYGSYRTLALLGEGGMGQVFLAEHVRLGRQVALKVLKPRLARRPEMLQQFFDEARAVNRIRHPNIVDVMDFVAEDGVAYCVMEYLPGQTLSKTLRLAGGALPPARALSIAAQVAEALQAAHDAGIVHLDVKPSNILLVDCDEDRDVVKLMDFGTSRLMEEKDDEWAERETAPLFTPVYMSPEQGHGQEPDHRSDIYSLGVVLYEMLTGAPPFKASSLAEYCYKHMREAPRRITQLKGLPHRVPRRVSQATMRCLEKDPAARFQSMQALQQVLENPRMDSGRFRSLSAGEHGPAPRRWPWLVGGGVALCALAAALILWRAWPADPSSLSLRLPTPPKVAPQAAPNLVYIRLRSDPSGAEVFDPGPPWRLIGLTPLSIHRPRTTQTWRLKIRHPGYRERSISVSLDRSRTLIYALEAAPRPRPTVSPERPAARQGEPRRAALRRAARDHGERRRAERRRAERRRAERRRARGSADRDSTVNPFD